MLIFCAGNSVLQPCVELHSRPHEICNHMSYNWEKSKSDFHSCVLEFARYAETLTVAASLKNANEVLSDVSIIEALQPSICRLTILSCNDSRSFPVMRSVGENFVRNGAVRELCIGHCTLTSDMLKELLEFGATDTDSSFELRTDGDSEATGSWTHDECDSSGESKLDLYDIALQPCTTNLLPSSFSAARCRCSAHSGLSEGRGIQALTLINLKSTSGSVDMVLSDMLPRLCQLKKLALIGLTEMHWTRTLYLDRTSQNLCLLVQCGQLSHVIIDGCWLPPNFLSMLLSALLRRCRYVSS